MSEERKLVRVAHMEVAVAGEVLVTLGLGSCVAILLHDPVARVAGLAHVLLPDEPASRDRSNPAKFVTTAVPELVRRMEELGARADRLSARMAGGASMFGALMQQNSLATGARNVASAREVLRSAGIPLVAEDVGLEHGRSVLLRASDGHAEVSTVLHGSREL